MSALPPNADINRCRQSVCLVPIANISKISAHVLASTKDRLATTRAGGGVIDLRAAAGYEAQPRREPQFILTLPLHDWNGADRIRR